MPRPPLPAVSSGTATSPGEYQLGHQLLDVVLDRPRTDHQAQEALAERAGMSVYGIQKLERGSTHPYRDSVTRFAFALELVPDEADQFRAAAEPVGGLGSAQREPVVGAGRHNLPVALTGCRQRSGSGWSCC